MKKTADLAGIDYVKLAMAYCVVAIHAESHYLVASHWGDAVEWLIRLAVPFFFAVTGFFTAKELEGRTVAEARQTLRSHSRRRFVLFLKWSALYLPMALFFARKSTVEEALRIAETYVLGGSLGIAMFVWFIYSTAIVFLLLSLTGGRRSGLAVMAGLFVIAYIAGWCTNHGVTEYNFYVDHISTGALGGGIYMMAGMSVFKFRDTLAKHRIAAICIALVLSVALFLLKLPFGELAGGIGLLVWGVTAQIPSTTASMQARRMSMWVYFTHTWWMVAVAAAMKLGMPSEAPLNFAIMAAGATVTSLICVALAKRVAWVGALVR